MKTLLSLISVLLALSVPRLALGTSEGGQAQATNGFKFYSGTMSAGVDTGLETEEGIVEDNVVVLVPTAIAYRNKAPRHDLQFIYVPEAEVFETHRELNALNHAAGISYSLEATRNLRLHTTGTFLRTRDRSRFSSTLIAAPQGLYTEGRGDVSIDYRFSRQTSVRVGLTSWFTRTEVPDSASASGSIGELLNNVAFDVSRRLGSIHQLVVRYARLQSSLMNPEDLLVGSLEERQGQDFFDVGYNASFPSGLHLAVSAGGLRLSQEIGPTQYTYTFSGTIDKSWRSWRIAGTYQRSLAAYLNLGSENPADQVRDPLATRNAADWLGATISGEFASRLRVASSLQLSRIDLQDSPDRLDSAFVALTLGVVVADSVVPFVSLSHWDRGGTEFTEAFNRTRVTAGLRFYWDAPSPRRDFREHESVRSILPVRRVQ